MSRFWTPALALFLAVTLVACDANSVDSVSANAVGTMMLDTPEASAFGEAVRAADKVDALDAEGPFTIFVPVNSAFEAMDPALRRAMMSPEHRADLRATVDAHTVAGDIEVASLAAGSTITAVDGTELQIVTRGDTRYVNGAEIVGEARAGNGRIIFVLAFIISPFDIPTTAEILGFNNLLAAVEAAGLGEALSGRPKFTVMAPTDEAFENLAAALGLTLDEVLALDILPDVLLYHVVGAPAFSWQLLDGTEVTTLQGQSWTIDRESDDPFPLDRMLGVDTDGDGESDSEVVVADVLTRGGVIHAIDTVLLPSL
ncbi:MAG: fasciclin domain-containing protein [Rhodothermaceae bacterium]|nr:fasciclin domain-containing protein [Rhodothermaceae bacterium]